MQNPTCMASFFYMDTHHKHEVIFLFGAELLPKFLHILAEVPEKCTVHLQKERPFSELWDNSTCFSRHYRIYFFSIVSTVLFFKGF